MTVNPAVAPPQEPPGASERVMTCFVIGPIGDKLAPVGTPDRQDYERSLEVYEDVIRSACQKFGIEPIRADQIARAGEITEQICRHILEDDIVIADVGGGNANVMYELGLRHVTGKLTIQIGEHGRLPFDIAPLRTIRFERTQRGLISARVELEKALDDGIRSGFEPLTPARILLGLKELDTERDTAPPVEDDDAPGLLDEIVAAEDGIATMTQEMEEITESVETIAELTDQSGAELERVTRSGASMNARMAAVARYAESIAGPSEELEKTAKQFAERMTTMDSAIRAALSMIELIEPEERSEHSREFLDQLMGLSRASREGMEGLNAFGTAAEGLGGMSRHLRGPAKHISSAVKQLAAAMACIDEWESAARSILSRTST